jgi:aminopeptidase
MTTLLVIALLSQADAGAWPLPVPQPAPVMAGRPNDATIAWQVVTRAADVKPGELVLITGGQQDRRLLEEIAVYVQKAGGYPVLEIDSQSLERASLVEVPAAADSSIATGARKLFSALDTIITIPHALTSDYLAGVPAERRASHATVLLKTEELANRRGIKRVELGNGMYPTEDNARRFKLDRAQLSTTFFSALAVDPAELVKSGAKVAAALQAGKQARLTHKNGTDLRFTLAGKQPTVSEGALSEDDVRAGGARTLSWLPAGEVYVTPAPGSAEGNVFIDRAFYAGSEIVGLRLAFKGGRLLAMSASQGLELLEAAYAAEGDPRKGDFGFVDIGLNPKLDAQKILTFTSSGMVTIGFGNNLWAGGDNNVPFEVGGCYLPGATLTVDGKPLVKDGKLVAP